MKQKGGGGHEMEDADEGDVDHLVETCTLLQGSELLERKDHLVHLDNLQGLRAFACLVDEDDVGTRQRSSPPRKIWCRLYIFFYTFVKSSPPRRIFCSCLRAERGAAGDSRQLSADRLLTRTTLVLWGLS